ncbi:recombinase family protein [Amycolatopsis taiwanensis]|uniref:recombinase family protein n=1 Tax=Amycolatopsis taiwanensis TaxID=342230 RepID=UPI000486FAF8|nr:recombinase family protein [Amycolatopsis taiwanensis]
MPDRERAVYYGYLHSEEDHGTAVEAAYEALVSWCVDQGRYLSTVFRDVGISSYSLRRPGFTGLLDALELPDSAGVVVIDWSHLSQSKSVAKRLALAVRRTGAVLLLRDSTLPTEGTSTTSLA